MASGNFTILKGQKLTEAQLREVEEAKKTPITFDEDCEELITPEDYLIAEAMTKVAMYNITGNSEKPSEFEKRLAEREFENLLKNF